MKIRVSNYSESTWYNHDMFFIRYLIHEFKQQHNPGRFDVWVDSQCTPYAIKATFSGWNNNQVGYWDFEIDDITYTFLQLKYSEYALVQGQNDEANS